jgi:hypothetical protein
MRPRTRYNWPYRGRMLILQADLVRGSDGTGRTNAPSADRVHPGMVARMAVTVDRELQKRLRLTLCIDRLGNMEREECPMLPWSQHWSTRAQGGDQVPSWSVGAGRRQAPRLSSTTSNRLAEVCSWDAWAACKLFKASRLYSNISYLIQIRASLLCDWEKKYETWRGGFPRFVSCHPSMLANDF